MPELPDLEVFSANLTRKLAGKKLVNLSIHKRAKLNTTSTALKKALAGKTLKRVFREGKELRFDFGKTRLGIHLMLRGKLYWIEENAERPHTILRMDFAKKMELGLTDFQYSARLTLDPNISDVPDALSITSKQLREKLQSKAGIKNLLLDQKVVRGIGNAYADEILWEARISPFSIANKIPSRAVMLLHRSIKRVLKNAQKQIKKADPNIIGGELREFLVVHNSKKTITPTGGKVRKADSGRRTTYYSNEQLMYK